MRRAQASSVGKTVTGSDYTNEYNLTFHLVLEDGAPKIAVIKEFVDSLYSAAFFKEERQRFAAYKEAQAAGSQSPS